VCHPALLFLVGCVGKQRDIARPFDCFRKHALVRGAVASDSSGNNLAALGNIVLKQSYVLEIDEISFFNAEAADSSSMHATAASRLHRPPSIHILVAIVSAVAVSVSVFVITRHSVPQEINILDF
jgi:hypothetical protein